MSGMHHDHEAVTADHDGRQPRRRGVMVLHEADLGTATADAGQHLGGVRDLDRQDDVGGFPVQGTDPSGQQMLGDGQGRRDPQPSAATTAATPSIMASAAASTRWPSSVICCPAGVSLVPGRPALQEGDAEAAFQLALAHAHGGLRHTVADGGLAEAAQLGHGVQELQGEQIRRRWRQHTLTVA